MEKWNTLSREMERLNGINFDRCLTPADVTGAGSGCTGMQTVSLEFDKILVSYKTTTVAKTRTKYWIVEAHGIAKSVKLICVFCREMSGKAESQVMADLPPCHLAPFTSIIPPVTTFAHFKSRLAATRQPNTMAFYSRV